MAQKPLTVRLSVEDADKVKRALQNLGEEGQRTFRRIEQSAEKPSGPLRALNTGVAGLQGSIGGLLRFAGPLAAMFSAGALVSFTRRSLDVVGGLGELAEQTGTTTTRLQELQFAAAQSGISSAELERGLQRLSQSVGDAAAGTGEAAGAFDRLGVRLTDSEGRMRGTDAILRDVADGLQKIDDPATRASVAMDIFGRNGAALLPILSGGSARLDEFARAANDAGVVLDEKMIAEADRASDALAAMDFALQRTGQTAAVTFAGDVADAAEAVQDMLRWIKSPDFDDNPMIRFFKWLNDLDTIGSRARNRTVRSILGMENADDLRRDLDVVTAQIAEAEEQLVTGAVSRSMEGTFRANMDAMIARRSELTRQLGEMEGESGGLKLTINRGLPATPAPAPGIAIPAAPARAAGRSGSSSAKSRTDAKTEADREAEAIGRVVDSLRFEADQITRSGREQAVMSALRQAGIDESHDQANAVREAAEAQYSLSEASKALDEIMREGSDSARLFGAATKDATSDAKDMESAILGGLNHALTSLSGDFSNLGEVAVSVLQHIITELIRMQDVANGAGKSGPLSGIFDFAGDFLGGIFGGGSGGGSSGGVSAPASLGSIGNVGFDPGSFGFARGAAFDRGRVTAFAAGGIVGGPTLFPMADGAGLMGEAGPEAIMPLARLRDGALGVRTAGGGAGGDGGGRAGPVALTVNVYGAKGNAEIEEMARAGALKALASQRTTIQRGAVEMARDTFGRERLFTRGG